jgi:hypothetical protein
MNAKRKRKKFSLEPSLAPLQVWMKAKQGTSGCRTGSFRGGRAKVEKWSNSCCKSV